MRRINPLFILFICLVAGTSGCASDQPEVDAPPVEEAPEAEEPPTEQPVPVEESQPDPTVEEVAEQPEPQEVSGPLQISSSAFDDGGVIPEQYSCMGDNLSPPLEWSGVPAAAESLLLFVYDPDAGFDLGASVEPGFVHWVVYNIPPDTEGYPQDVPGGGTLTDGALQGSNDFAQFESEGATFPGGAPVKLVGYDGPCPPSEHRYIFALYALDAALDVAAEAPMTEIVGAMEGHIIDQAEWMGLYAPPG